ncbi:radical SAM protein [Verrucomicrobia bacterium LW23]|nr:radical SAM protein [Verrucomicrobia bacterium LW23]
MLISEIFYSVQGEGSLTGVPSIFIRTSGCNLRCVWCDTPYTSWNPEGTRMSVQEILAETRRHAGARHAVVTGGEPMLAPEIFTLTNTLRDNGFHITIETAGTVPPRHVACDLASLSPKLGHSTPPVERAGQAWHDRHEATRLNLPALREWIATVPDFQLKFVVRNALDVEEIRTLLDALAVPIPPWRVHLMPEGTSMEAIGGRQMELVELCKLYGYRYCHRLHVQLFGHKRGT